MGKLRKESLSFCAHCSLYWRLVLQELKDRAGSCEWSLPDEDQGRSEPLVSQLPPLSVSVEATL